MRFGIWNVRSVSGAGSPTAAAREFSRYKLDLVGVMEFRWDKGATVRAGIIIFSMKKGRKSFWNRIFVHHRMVSALEGVQFVSDRLSYTGCPRRNVPDFGRVFLMLKYSDITQNTYVQS